MADTNAPTSSSYSMCFNKLKDLYQSTTAHRLTNRVNIATGTAAYALDANSDPLIMATTALIAVGSSMHTLIHGDPHHTEKTVQAYLLVMAGAVCISSLIAYAESMVCDANSTALICKLIKIFLAFYGVPAFVIALGSEASKKDESTPAPAQTPAAPDHDVENPVIPAAATSASASTLSTSQQPPASQLQVLHIDADDDDDQPTPSTAP